MSEAIIVEDLVKRFKDVTAINGISFRVRRSEVYGLLGPNGAGKTTTIHILVTLLKPTFGKAFVAGFDVIKESAEVRKRIGVVFQEPSLDIWLTAYDNIYIHGKLYGLSGRELKRRIYELLDFVELKPYAGKLVAYFSGGMRRRLEIARTLLHEPEVLFLDEPTLGLDPQTRIRIWDYIMRIRKEHGTTILLTTHYMDEADELCERIAIMDRGKIKAEGRPEELKAMIGSDVIYIKLDDQPKVEVSLEADFAKSCTWVSGDTIQLIVHDAPSAIPKILEAIEKAKVKVREVTYRRPTLNEVFIHLTGRDFRDSLKEGCHPPRPPRMRR